MDREEDLELKKMLEEETEEIKKHVWIESQKAGRDLYPEAAIDWIKQFATVWRDEYEKRRFK